MATAGPSKRRFDLPFVIEFTVKREITGKFRGAIIESGSPLNTWAFRASGLPYAIDLALSVNGSLPDMTTEQLVVYLQSLDAKQIDVASTVTTVISVLQS